MSDLMILSANDITAQVNHIQQIMAAVMKDGTHYGKVPGCGDKPTLLKPGAEKLSLTFRLRPVMDNDRDIRIDNMSDGHREVSVYCHILNSEGLELATGVGSCSTMESKYRYRNSAIKCPACGVEAIIKGKKEYGGGWLCFAKRGGCGAKFSDGDTEIELQPVGKQENPDIADTYNTVLKMAKKRAYVDGILSATGASDIFTQDIEDFPNATIATSTEPVKPPQPKAGDTVQGEVISSEIPNCSKCGLPIGTTEVQAHKVADWCAGKGWELLCTKCQPKK